MPSRLVNVVPTPATRRLAAAMIHDAHQTTGPDAAVKHLAKLRPEQCTALIGLLLTQVKAASKTGRPSMPLTLSAEDRRRGYAAYRRGERTAFAERAYREYQRANQRARRARTGLRQVG
ncbi:hypothetical protein [Nocardioides sp. SR21]|uniref:hypothetical protein n=1 Tax=Nocardioides sp. SR21 TaxID=2919501 RepID=UPI001FAAFBF5|nr:hypothetical protein [Nocardioides sp. SR21]